MDFNGIVMGASLDLEFHECFKTNNVTETLLLVGQDFCSKNVTIDYK